MLPDGYTSNATKRLIFGIPFANRFNMIDQDKINAFIQIAKEYLLNAETKLTRDNLVRAMRVLRNISFWIRTQPDAFEQKFKENIWNSLSTIESGLASEDVLAARDYALFAFARLNNQGA